MEACSFQKGKGGGVDLREKGGVAGQLIGVKEGKTMFRMYYMREESIFIKLKEKHCSMKSSKLMLS